MTIFYHDDASDCDDTFANLSSNLFLQDNMDPSQDDVAEVIKDDLWYDLALQLSPNYSILISPSLQAKPTAVFLGA